MAATTNGSEYPIDLRNPHRPIRVGVVLLGGETEVLDVAPVDIFAELNRTSLIHAPEAFCPPHLKAQALDFEFIWVNESGTTAKLTAGMEVKMTHSFSNCPQLDILLMGAAPSGSPTPTDLQFLRTQHPNLTAFLCICYGSQAPLMAGLLDNLTATGPREMLPMMRAMHPKVKFVEKRWVRDGKMWTSGALLNGLDLVRAFVGETWGTAADGKGKGEGLKPTENLADWAVELGHWPDRGVEYEKAAIVF